MAADNQFNFLVGPTDTDSYNIVHHPMYLVWCESAIYSYMTSHPDVFPVQAENGGIAYEIAHINCKFLSPARLHDCVIATVAGPKALRAGAPAAFRVQLRNGKTGAAVMDAKFELKLELTLE